MKRLLLILLCLVAGAMARMSLQVDKDRVEAGKTFKLVAKAVPQNKKLKVKKHRAIAYETSNPGVAKVSKKGVVTAKAAGACYVYAYAQDGVSQRIKVTVK